MERAVLSIREQGTADLHLDDTKGSLAKRPWSLAQERIMSTLKNELFNEVSAACYSLLGMFF